MARTKQQLTDLSATRIREQTRKTLNWGQFIAALNSLTTPKREVLVAAVIKGQVEAVGSAIVSAVNQNLRADADAEATTILAKNNVTLTELDRIL